MTPLINALASQGATIRVPPDVDALLTIETSGLERRPPHPQRRPRQQPIPLRPPHGRANGQDSPRNSDRRPRQPSLRGHDHRPHVPIRRERRPASLRTLPHSCPNPIPGRRPRHRTRRPPPRPTSSPAAAVTAGTVTVPNHFPHQQRSGRRSFPQHPGEDGNAPSLPTINRQPSPAPRSSEASP